MLERTSTYLESGGRNLLRTSKPCLRSRRMLHSTFWHHAAGDISLPEWWAVPATNDSTRHDRDGHAAKQALSTASGPYKTLLLDFLYPEKTLSFLRQLTVPTSETLKPPRRRFHAAPLRHYTTLPPQPPQNKPSADSEEIQQTEDEATAVAEDPEALRKLQQLLALHEPGMQDRAWQLYRAVPPALFANNGYWDLRADLLDYLAVDDDPAVPSQVIQLFEGLREEQCRLSSYRAAIAAYVSLRMIGLALQLLESVPSYHNFDFSHIGIDLLLRRTIQDGQWELSLRIFRLFLERKPYFGRVPVGVSIRWGNELRGVWKGVSSLHNLEDSFHAFLGHVREFCHELRSSDSEKETLALFVMTFAPQVMDRILQDRTLSEQAVVKFFRQLFPNLAGLSLPLPECYEHAVKRLLKVPVEGTASDIPKLRADLYEQLRQYCVESSSTDPPRPSLNLIRNLIVHYFDHSQVAQAKHLIQDHRTFYPDEPMRAGLLKYLIHYYADHGDLEQVETHLDEFKAHYPDQVDLHLVSALPFACARRADVNEAITQFNRIHDDFGLVWDTACWNILLLAYSRADDLDGALGCYNMLLANEVAPDVYTFGTLLDICAQRGDVEAFEAIFSRAEQSGVDLSRDMRARSGYVQAFLQAGDAPGAEAVAQGMLKSWQAGTLRDHTLTHTWNLLIQQHALDGDIAGARQRYREMIEADIPLDAWTYGSLMRALIEVKQTNAAFKLLRKTMPQSNLRPQALHYAIVMTGFLREGGGQQDLAIETYKMMIEKDVPQTASSQEATIRTLGASQIHTLREQGVKKRDYRLEDVEKAVEDMVASAVQRKIVGQNADREPRHSRLLDYRSSASSPQSFYGLLISLYAQRGAYKRCREMMKKAQELAPDADNYVVPMNIITGSMEMHLQADEHEDVARLWRLARNSANNLTKTFSRAAEGMQSKASSADLLDPNVMQQHDSSRISGSRRNILYKATRVYIRSLLAPSNQLPNALQEAQQTMRELLVEGYNLDVFTWNELVSTLALRGHLEDAFNICEEYLMPNFPGWRELHPNYIRKDRKGYKWMELRHYDVRKDRIMPRYKTLIVLAAAYRDVKRDERNGVGYNEKSEAWQADILEKGAPRTCRAIQTMPRTNDPLQVQFFHGGLY
ncbi:hypothetical protein BDU57DRAFT_521389 [Ampelomyces quisqualis]|uniref:Pentacotripeptide-repeat region of PRORP domain-containing protein n=1 Tax=Ampelomyces quisqualis TaxID=50730 RepID=A0A6A5QBC3_AMPQU|nr:hypothetical protein BDU57DRAFT_521389 [Ampelomyces quisqualis]